MNSSKVLPNPTKVKIKKSYQRMQIHLLGLSYCSKLDTVVIHNSNFMKVFIYIYIYIYIYIKYLLRRESSACM
jgi:hypothetical protein